MSLVGPSYPLVHILSASVVHFSAHSSVIVSVWTLTSFKEKQINSTWLQACMPWPSALGFLGVDCRKRFSIDTRTTYGLIPHV